MKLTEIVQGTFKTKKSVNVSQPTISRIIKKVTSLLSEIRLRFIKIPDKTEFKNISTNFLSTGEFPEVFGCICSTHIPIKSPGKSICDGYFNENGFYSFRVFVGGNSIYKTLNFNATFESLFRWSVDQIYNFMK